MITATAAYAGPPTLKDAFKDDFLIGAAINEKQFSGVDKAGAALIAEQFNCITPENVLKWGLVHPEPGRYNFGPSDRYVEFGEQNHLRIIGHNLVWHEQTPKWVFEDDQGRPLTREALLARMSEHIHELVGRYKGRIQGWDVVNEALAEDGSMRQTSWLKIIGDDYIEKAFQFAHEADPDAELYYNDYSLENEPKRKGAIALVNKLKSRGVPITALGSQDHIKMDWPSPELEDATLTDFSKLGVKVMITELDVDMLPPVVRGQTADISTRAKLEAVSNPYTNGLPADVQNKLAARYAAMFKVYLKHRDIISRVTFWGVSDGDSWLNNWPVRGRTSYPLLFDRDHQPKPAVDALIKTARDQK